jgi:hypothetical protein
MEDLRCFTLHFFFEIKDAEIYGGKGTTGYAEMTYDKATNAEAFTADSYIEHSKTNAQILANQLHVPVENIAPIHRDKYDEMTKSEEDVNDDYDDSDSFADWEKG